MSNVATTRATGPSDGAGPAREVGGTFARWWFPGCVLVLIFASDYALRKRATGEALRSSIDAAIIIELALYGLVAACLVIARATSPNRLRPRPHLYFACLYVGLMGLAVGYTPYKPYAAVRAGQMCILLALVLAGAAHCTRAHFHRFAHAYLVLVVLSVVYGVAVPSTPVSRLQAGRFTWLAIHPTVSGVLAGLATLIAIAYATSAKRPRPGPTWSTLSYVLALVIVAGGLLASQTRGAIIGVVAGAMVLVLASVRGRAVIESALAIMVLVAGVTLAFSGPVADYFERDADSENLTSLNSRTDLWAVAVDSVGESPMFGHGLTAAQGIFYDETGLGGGHNAVVNVVVELGAVGLATWLALCGTLLVGTRRLPRDGPGQVGLDRALLLAVQVFLLVDGIVYQGAGAVTNVAATFLLVSVAWLTVAERATGSEPTRRRARPMLVPRPLDAPRSTPVLRPMPGAQALRRPGAQGTMPS